ncbi:MAG TPA: beta-ketoacyl-ACP synthase III [Dehalococcoidia bacterium]|jgi:3-oxoacyl-[acyl-carrier-protein] synthase-3|nr:beta-ketoacyl-ACP synthase III [Dehalococcoidia bacterium]
MAARIAGVGKYLPSKVLTNAELERMVETSNEWIVDRTGIRERRLAAEDETTATMGAAAGRMALETAGLRADQLDLIICATCSPDGMFPASASLIQESLGATSAGAFDINAACTGFLAALATGTQFINAGVYERVLVVGAEVLSRIIDWSDRTTCVLFGDGAGAVLLEKAETGGVGPFVLKSDGSGARLLYARGPASSPHSVAESEGFCIVMDGREVFRFAVRAMEEVTRQAIGQAGLTVEDVDFVVPHQANQRIISAVGKAMNLPPERLITNVEKYGNTSSASIPVALCEAWEEGRFKPGDRIALVAFGGGLVWGASLLEWTGLGSESTQAAPKPWAARIQTS